MDRFKKFLNRETVSYLIFGVLTTVVNYVVFHLMYTVVLEGKGSLVANFVAWVAAVVFAYVVNKCFVFESKSWAWSVLRREIPAFVAARVASFGIEEVGLFISENLLKLNTVTVLALGSIQLDGVTVSKLALSVIVVVLNYFFSKWFIFKK
jgi:putative flippase GtrA